MDKSDRIAASWFANAANWIAAIDNDEIETRKLGTNQAIVDTVLLYPVHTILDIGCGEGWLTRALRNRGRAAYGVDMVPELVENAIKKGGDYYRVCPYRGLVNGIKLARDRFDAAVMNFSLLDKDDAETLLKALHRYLDTDGLIFIQTLHPAALGDVPISGWRDGSWNGLNGSFTKPYDWYFRTREDWMGLFTAAGLKTVLVKEPLHPLTEKPLSLLFVLQIINSQ